MAREYAKDPVLIPVCSKKKGRRFLSENVLSKNLIKNNFPFLANRGQYSGASSDWSDR